MADQMGPLEKRHGSHQPPNASGPAEQDFPAEQGPPQRFVAPAESFGSFGPLPDYPAEVLSPAPFTMASLPETTPIYPYAPAQPGATPYAGVFRPGYSSVPGNSHASEALPYSPSGVNAPPAIPLKTKKLIHFPLTRKASVLLQIGRAHV